ncbi:Nudix family hydrolase [Arenimonas sp.]|uniref:Nudix family hydrolase n=1 Tax=Arenimonas sp. TaxID=1872635 RepID=UPI0039E26870
MSSRDPIHVVAGVIADARGRILLARRTAGRDLAGAWEFPGGKLEAGEAPLAALDRELHEELGIRVLAAEPLLAVPQQYPTKRIVLDVWRVTRFSGKPHGREKQALAWSPPEKLHTYPMPSADRPVVSALTEPDRYLITPEPGSDTRAFLRGIEKAIEGGIRRIQLRARELAPDRLSSLAEQVRSRCREHDVELLLNGDIELAHKLGCGVHLRSSQLASLAARPLPVDLPVAASCHDVEELRRAEALDVDFAVLGPVARTPTHKEREPIGWSGFASLRESVSLPIYALGGLKPGEVAIARRHGAQGIAAIRGLWSRA